MRYKDGAYALDTEGSGETFAGRQRLQSLGEFPPVFLTFTFQMEQTDAEGAVGGAGAGVHSREWQKMGSRTHMWGPEACLHPGQGTLWGSRGEADSAILCAFILGLCLSLSNRKNNHQVNRAKSSLHIFSTPLAAGC